MLNEESLETVIHILDWILIGTQTVHGLNATALDRSSQRKFALEYPSIQV
jgi:hypothetical protein